MMLLSTLVGDMHIYRTLELLKMVTCSLLDASHSNLEDNLSCSKHADFTTSLKIAIPCNWEMSVILVQRLRCFKPNNLK